MERAQHLAGAGGGVEDLPGGGVEDLLEGVESLAGADGLAVALPDSPDDQERDLLASVGR